jgi:hypothetical protein
MKTKPLTFLLALTFLFLFSSSSAVLGEDINSKNTTIDQDYDSLEKKYIRNPYFPIYTEQLHVSFTKLEKHEYGLYPLLIMSLVMYWFFGRTKKPLLSTEGIFCGIIRFLVWFGTLNIVYFFIFV